LEPLWKHVARTRHTNKHLRHQFNFTFRNKNNKKSEIIKFLWQRRYIFQLLVPSSNSVRECNNLFNVVLISSKVISVSKYLYNQTPPCVVAATATGRYLV